MFDPFTTQSVVALLPGLTLVVPVAGEVNFQPVVAAALVFIGLTALFWLIRMVILQRLKALAARTTGQFDDVLVDAVRSVRVWVYSVIALYASVQFFTLPLTIDYLLTGSFYFAVVWQGIEIATKFIEYFTTQYLATDSDGDGVIDPQSATAADMVKLMARIILWVLGVLFVMSNVGIEVTSLLAGLGIGGIAIAFALQGVLSDLFASFSLYFDKPFRIGDFIIIGPDSGTVEKIGIKTTRIRTLQGEELVVSNTELTTARVQNFKKMHERRVLTDFGITYETPHELVKTVPEIISHIFADLEGGRLDRIHFISFGDSALIFELVYFVDSADYTQYLNIQQEFNFALMQRFAELGIEFAYPTQTIYAKTVS